MYQALYRKWRPRTFDEVAGQEHITRTLKSQVQSGKLSHAYLFIGTRGTGKTTCAKLLARAVNCENPQNGNPCNACRSCLGIESGEIMDVVELDAASNNGVDNVRSLREEAIFSPISVKKRVYIIDEAHMLSGSAFNALLKILEEPPEHLMFILATTELHKVPATILSRCQRYSFRRIDDAVISARLAEVAENEKIELSQSAAALLARLAEGSLRDALSLLDQCSGAEAIDDDAVLSAMGLAGSHRTIALLDAIAAHNTAAALELFSALWQDGKAADTLLTELAILMRDTLMSGVAPGSALLSGAFDTATLKNFSAKIGSAQLLTGISAIMAAIAELRQSQSPKTHAELCIVRLCEPELQDDFASLAARVEILEGGCAAAPAPQGSVPQAAPEIIPTPEPKPEPETAPESVQETPEEDESAEFWDILTDRLKGRLSKQIYVNLSMATAARRGDTLTICAGTFVTALLETPETSEIIKAEASLLAGTPIALKFDEPDKLDKLDSLSKFKNVRFN